jgi:hypothetical protein
MSLYSYPIYNEIDKEDNIHRLVYIYTKIGKKTHNSTTGRCELYVSVYVYVYDVCIPRRTTQEELVSFMHDLLYVWVLPWNCLRRTQDTTKERRKEYRSNVCMLCRPYVKKTHGFFVGFCCYFVALHEKLLKSEHPNRGNLRIPVFHMQSGACVCMHICEFWLWVMWFMDARTRFVLWFDACVHVVCGCRHAIYAFLHVIRACVHAIYASIHVIHICYAGSFCSMCHGAFLFTGCTRFMNLIWCLLDDVWHASVGRLLMRIYVFFTYMYAICCFYLIFGRHLLLGFLSLHVCHVIFNVYRISMVNRIRIRFLFRLVIFVISMFFSFSAVRVCSHMSLLYICERIMATCFMVNIFKVSLFSSLNCHKYGLSKIGSNF